MAQQYEAKGRGLDGVPLRVEVYNSSYGGSTVTTLQAGKPFLRIDAGEDDDDRTNPLWPRELRFWVKDNTDLSGLFGLPQRDVRIDVYREDEAALVFRGYLLTDFLEQEPWRPGGQTVQLRATDGLGSLEDLSVDLLSSAQDVVPVRQALQDVLNLVYPTTENLNVQLAFNFYHYFEGAQLSAQKNPLDYTLVNVENYRETPPDSSEWLSAKEMLLDICDRFGLWVHQRERAPGDAVWHVRNDAAIDLSTGDLETWEYNPDGSQVSTSPFNLNVLETIDKTDPDAPEKYYRQRSRVVFDYRHVDIQNFIQNPGFEAGGGSLDDWDDNNGSDWSTSAVDKDQTLYTPSGAGDDFYVGEERYEVYSGRAESVEDALIQALGSIPETVGPFSAEFAGEHGWDESEPNTDTLEAPQFMRFTVTAPDGTVYKLNTQRAFVESETDERSSKIVLENPLDAPIPKGAVLSIGNQGNNALGDEPGTLRRETITLEQQAQKGDEVLVGDISGPVFTDDMIGYLKWTTGTQSLIALRDFHSVSETGEKKWGEINLPIFWGTPDGAPIFGEIELTLAMYTKDYGVSSGDPTPWRHYYGFDNLELRLNISKAVEEATDNSIGETDRFEVRIGDGPTNTNFSRLRAVGNDDSTKATTEGWKKGTYADGEASTELSIGEIVARERLRFFRTNAARKFLTIYPEKGDSTFPRLTGDELVEINGTTYLVSSITHTPDEARIDVVLLEYTDDGVVGMETSKVGIPEEGGSESETSSVGSTTTTSSSGRRHVIQFDEPTDLNEGDIWLKVPAS